MMLADVSLSSRGDSVVATLTGEIDMSNVGELKAVLSEATPNDAAGLVLDLSGLDYLDSAGIQLMFRLHADLRTRAQALVLVIPEHSVVAETFRLAGVTGRMTVAATVDEAIALVTPEPASP